VTEIPPLMAEMTEYQLHTLVCSACGARTAADLPAGVPQGAFGPRVQAMVATLSGEYHLNKRQIEALLADCFGVELGLGTVSALEQATGTALEAPVAEVQAAVKEQPVANVDETSWQEGNGRAWLWVVVTQVATVFLIRLSRGSLVAKELLSEAFSGVVVSDRWSGYNWVPSQRRQVCWAHLLRDFEGFVGRGGESERIGRLLLGEAARMFHWWHRVRDGTLRGPEFIQRCRHGWGNCCARGQSAIIPRQPRRVRTSWRSRVPCGPSCIWRGSNPPTAPPNGRYGQGCCGAGEVSGRTVPLAVASWSG